MLHSNLDTDIETMNDELMRDLDAMIERLITLKINTSSFQSLNVWAFDYVVLNFGRLIAMMSEIRSYELALESVELENRPEAA